MIVPHLFERDGPTGLYVARVELGCEWVAAREGVATRMRDGVTVRVRGETLWRAYVAHVDGVPNGFEVGPPGDEATGWVPVSVTDPADAWLRQALIPVRDERTGNVVARWYPVEDGTYEYCGPRVGGNYEGLARHAFFRHGAEVLDVYGWAGEASHGDDGHLFDVVRGYLGVHRVEGIVWHHPDGRMAKATRRGFGLRWPPEAGWRGTEALA